MAVTTARRKILAYVTAHRTASARAISRGLEMSPATVRHHLRVLLADGRVALSASRCVRATRGRPEKVYSIPRATLGDNLPALSEALFAESGGKIRVEALAKRLAGEANFRNQPAARRLNLIVEKMNQMKYHARWEAGAGGPRVIFGHCPYAAIIAKRPELCRMDAALLRELFGEEFQQIAKIENLQGACIFVK